MAAKRPLEAADLDRLSKLCGLFSSDFEGERANAAGLADRYLRDRGWRWSDVIHAPTLPPPGAGNDDDRLASWPGGWRAAARFCVGNSRALTAWERDFCVNLLGYVGAATVKQCAILRRVLEKVLDAGCAP
jgi:hypothetical protein